MPRPSAAPAGPIQPHWRGKRPARLELLLSPAERVVFGQIKRGLSIKEIAEVLNKSRFTVKQQVASVLKKLEAPSRCQLIAWLHEHAPRGEAR